MTDETHAPTGTGAIATDAVADETTEQPVKRPLHPAVCLAIGLAAGLLGLLPWLVTGMRLPLQNLWAVPVSPDAMPLVLLPFSQYAITTIPGLLVTGSAVAGLVVRVTRDRQPRRGLLATALGVLTVYAVAGVQTWLVVESGLEQSRSASIYLAAMSAVILVSLAIAMIVLALVARSRVPGATIALTTGALAAGIWLNSLLAPIGFLPNEPVMWLLGLTRWVPPVLVGIAVGWCGVRTVGRAVAVVASLLLLWIGPALVTAVGAATGSRILVRYPAEMLDYGIGVFNMASTIPELVLPPLLVAVGVGAVVWLVLRARRSRSRGVNPLAG